MSKTEIKLMEGKLKASLRWWKKLGKKEQESKGNHQTAKLIASAPDMLELLKNILVEVRPEISRVNELHDQTIFNPVATETIDMAREIINKAEGK